MQHPDTLLAVEEAMADLNMRGLLKGQIGIDTIRLRQGKMDSDGLWPDLSVNGQVGELSLLSGNVDLKEKRAEVGELRLTDCDVAVTTRPSEEKDTTESTPPDWLITADRIRIERTHLALALEGDSMQMETMLSEAELRRGEARLSTGRYEAESLTLRADSLCYDRTDQPRKAKGLDTNHLALRDLHLAASNCFYDSSEERLGGTVVSEGMKERSGLTLERLEADVEMDHGKWKLSRLEAETPHSRISAKGTAETSALKPGGGGQMDVEMMAQVGEEDVRALADESLLKMLNRMGPLKPLNVRLSAQGNVDSLYVKSLEAEMEGVAQLETSGWVTDLLSPERQMGLGTRMNLRTGDLSMLNRLLGTKSFRLPPVGLSGDFGMQGDRLLVDAVMTERSSRAYVKGWYDTKKQSYDARIETKNLDLERFVKEAPLKEVTMTAKGKGNGFDLLNPKTRLDAEATVDHIRYKTYELDSIGLMALIRDGRGRMQLNGENSLFSADACAEADMKEIVSNASLDLDLRRLDARRLGLTPDSLQVGLILHAEGESDLKKTHWANVTIKGQQLTLPDTVFYPHDLKASLHMAPENMDASVEAGDLNAEMQSGQGLDDLKEMIDRFMAELEAQRKDYRLRQDTLRTLLPDLTLHIRSGNDNPLANILQTRGYTMESLAMDLKTDTLMGINGQAKMLALNTGAILLDTIECRVTQDKGGVRMDGRVRNSPKNTVVSFESLLGAELTSTGAEATLQFFDAKGRKGVDLGMSAEVMENGTRIHFEPLNPVIAYRNFQLNADNFVTMTNDRRIEALVDLLADDGTGIKFYSTPGDALQDLTVTVNQFNLGELAQVIPYLPKLEGKLHGDLHYLQSDSTTLSISTDMTVNQMKYKDAPLGNVGLIAVYLPNADGTHYVDGIVSQDEKEIMTLSGTYREEKDDNYLDGTAHLLRLPLSLADGFIPNNMANLRGYVIGDLEIAGSTSRPMLSGTLAADSMALVSVPYNLNLTFPNDTLRISQSHINLDRIEAYAAGKEPLTLDGTIDFSDLDAIALNVSVRASNYQLINAPKMRNSLAYGKANVNMFGLIRGTLDNLTMRGRLTVLGSTDLTYVLQDSPLTVEDRLADLVTFVDFTDTLETEIVKTKRQFIDMQLSIIIEQTAQIHCMLSETGQDYINLEGGGNLTLTYDNDNGMRMTGRYTILRGDMNYTVLPVVGSKHFTIENGSYVEFQGELTNPTLNISANERMRSTVSENNVPRSVAFDVGLHISQTLENMGLEFTLEAPEDITVQNELASMSSEDRGRLAVTMLATGMYLNDLSGTGGFSTSNTLNSYLQSEINNLVNLAQSTIDVNVGIENTTNEMGNTQTDYSFSFAKRFWGNRISVIIGGKVSSGADAQNTGQSIIDNISLEYRLDQSATRYIRIYYDHNYESLLEGEITEMGAGVVFRKKTEKLSELFIFRKKKDEPMRMPRTVTK